MLQTARFALMICRSSISLKPLALPFSLPTPQVGSPPTRLIAAWGDEESVEYHGTTNFAKGEVVVFGGAEHADVEPDVASDPEVSFFDVTTVSCAY